MKKYYMRLAIALILITIAAAPMPRLVALAFYALGVAFWFFSALPMMSRATTRYRTGYAILILMAATGLIVMILTSIY